jgi:hypothetical protein
VQQVQQVQQGVRVLLVVSLIFEEPWVAEAEVVVML